VQNDVVENESTGVEQDDFVDVDGVELRAQDADESADAGEVVDGKSVVVALCASCIDTSRRVKPQSQFHTLRAVEFQFALSRRMRVHWFLCAAFTRVHIKTPPPSRKANAWSLSSVMLTPAMHMRS